MCEEFYDKNEEEDHMEEEHKMVACEYCKLEFESSKLEKHS